MSNRSLPPNASQAFDFFASPAVFLGLWNPFLMGVSQLGGYAMEEIGALANEWQKFVGHRLTEDALFMQRLAKCKSADEIAAAHTDFWQTATAEYAKEFATVNKLVVGIGARVTPLHWVSDEATKTAPPSRAAA